MTGLVDLSIVGTLQIEYSMQNYLTTTTITCIIIKLVRVSEICEKKPYTVLFGLASKLFELHVDGNLSLTIYKTQQSFAILTHKYLHNCVVT